MFVVTKLRRGMISKDKEGGECWTFSHGEEPHVTSLFYSHPLSFLLVSWDNELVGKKTTPTPAHSLSTTCLLACPLPWSWACSVPSREGVKGFHNSLLGVCHFFQTQLASQKNVLPLFTQSFASFSHQFQTVYGYVMSIIGLRMWFSWIVWWVAFCLSI